MSERILGSNLCDRSQLHLCQLRCPRFSIKRIFYSNNNNDYDDDDVGCGGSLADSSPFVRMVAGSNPTLAAT